MSSPTPDAARAAARFAEAFPGRPPLVGMARVDAVPDGVAEVTGATAACSLWREGTHRVVAARADHGACAIGRYTQGFADGLPPGDEAVAAMLAIEYIDPEEVALLPHLPRGHAAIVYGPLADLPVAAEAALALATASQAMLLAEALGLMRAGAGGLPVSGRPTCMAIPAALLGDAPGGSLGCTGARVYADFADDEMIVVVPASLLGALAEGLPRAVSRNAAVRALAEVAAARARAELR